MLMIQLLGVPRLHFVGGSSRNVLGRTASLLGALLFHSAGKSFRRDFLADLFWPNSSEAQARAALNTNLWRIRRAIGTRARLVADRMEVCVELSDGVAVDACLYDTAARSALMASHPVTVGELQHVADMYVGPFLEGEDAEWAMVQRERLTELHLRILSLLAHKLAIDNQLAAAAEIGGQILQIDPYREQVHRDLIVLFTLLGRRNLALRQFGHLQNLLTHELGLDVDQEVVSLVDVVRSNASLVSFEQMRGRCFEPELR